jgi:hypothetical protein
MTPLVSDTTEIKIERVGLSLVQMVVGLILMAAGIAWGYADFRAAFNAKEQLHTTHMALCVGLVVFGALAGFTRFTAPVVDKLWIYVGQTNLPLIGGRRSSDPPAPPSKS